MPHGRGPEAAAHEKAFDEAGEQRDQVLERLIATPPITPAAAVDMVERRPVSSDIYTTEHQEPWERGLAAAINRFRTRNYREWSGRTATHTDREAG